MNSMKTINNTVKATVTMPVSVTCNGNVKESRDVTVRRNRHLKPNRLTYLLLYALCSMLYAFLFCLPLQLEAKITGVCSNCHTMHNSQNGQPMNFDSSATPNELLLRGSCIGCHAQNTGSNIDPLTGAPQVLHTGTDLAAGNFRYLATSDTNGHNVIDLGFNETTLTVPPGHHGVGLTNTNFTCAGKHGCHGIRDIGPSGYSGLGALKGAHHQNVDGKCETDISQIYGSYRFLWYVKGFENMGTYKWQNKDSDNHNEYFGATTPLLFQCIDCHHAPGVDMVWPGNNTISGFCATCHENFHVLSAGAPAGWGIGGGTSPFIRHPTDVVLPSDSGKEYRLYNTPDGNAKGLYSVTAPVARTTVPESPSPIVQPGTDVIMCLSCHSAHASPYFKMMRWDYKSSSLSTALSGCNVCHTSKN